MGCLFPGVVAFASAAAAALRLCAVYLGAVHITNFHHRGGQVTGVFCQSAIESAQQDHATVVQSMLENKEAPDNTRRDSCTGLAARLEPSLGRPWNIKTGFESGVAWHGLVFQ